MATTTEKPKNESNGQSNAQAPRPAVVAAVQQRLEAEVRKGLGFPADYSVANALAAARLELQKVVDRNGKPVVDANGRPTGVCTEASMFNAIFDMCVQGLSVAKKQGYLIVYGDQLVFQRSYFGDMALAERLMPGIEIYCDVIYKGEKFTTMKIRSNNGFRTVVKEHEQAWPRNSKEIEGAYCGAIDTNTGEDLGITLMDIDQIRTSWKKSKTIGDKSFHSEQPDQACLRTAIRRWSKPLINRASDAVLLESIRRQDADAIEAEVAEDAAEHANGEMMSLSPNAESIESVPQQAAEAQAEPVAVGSKEPF